MANAVKCIAKYVRKNEDEESAVVLRELCEALETGQPFELARLYDMKQKAFELAMDVLSEWRFDRHVTERRFSKYFEQDED
ncbi:MAG TPA: hypothetical protein PLW81_11895 [Thiobacillaceae bacterium]|nr:hypothetical protein [Thiobacillaceae bacterium]